MRYLNPGYKDWLTVIDASDTLTEETDTIKTKTGIAFSNTQPYSNFVQFDYPTSGEIFCKFDFYYPTSGSVTFCFGEFSEGSEPYNGLGLNFSTRILRFIRFVKGSWSNVFSGAYYFDYGFYFGDINSVLFHLKWTDSENGVMNLQVNNYVFAEIESADLTPYNNSKIKFSFENNSSFPVSNIIISDEEVSIKEQIVPITASDTFTTMTFDTTTGIYTADTAGQTILQSVNLNSIVADFGSTSKVTGVAMVGNPAFRTAEGLSSLTAIAKKNNAISEYGAVTVPTDSDSVVVSSFSVDSDTTLATLQNMQLGWKVGG
mgnify:CR=1 FL=1